MMMQFEGGNTQQKVNLIEERLKAIEGNSSIKGTDAIELSLVPYMVIPHKFKMPDFVKYNGLTCPKAHMMMDHGEIEFSEKIIKGSINVITNAKFIGESSEGRPRPLMIFFEDNLVSVANVNLHHQS